LIRSPTLPKDDLWVSTVLDFLLAHGLFILDKVNKKSKHEVVCHCNGNDYEFAADLTVVT